MRRPILLICVALSFVLVAGRLLIGERNGRARLLSKLAALGNPASGERSFRREPEASEPGPAPAKYLELPQKNSGPARDTANATKLRHLRQKLEWDKDRDIYLLVTRGYGPILDSLDLPPDRLRSVKQLLLEREITRRDVFSEGTKNHLSGRQIQGVLAAAIADLDAGLRAAAGDEGYGEIQQMLSLGLDLDYVTLNLNPEISLDASPMSGRQMLAIATLNSKTFQAAESSPSALLQGLDTTTGLTALDRQMLGQAAAILSAPQLAILQKSLEARTAAQLGSQIEEQIRQLKREAVSPR